jgi:autotransporter-associated beta strand protein
LNNAGAVNLSTSVDGAGRLNGTGQVGNVVMAANTGGNRAAINPGTLGQGDVGTLTLSSLQVNGGSLRFDLFSPGSTQDFIQVNGAATFSGAATIEPGPTGEVGTYTVMNASSISLGVAPTIVQPGDSRNAYTLDLSTPNQIKIGVTGGAKDLRWAGTASNEWDVVGAINWLDLNPPNAAERFFNGDDVVFNDLAAAANRSVVIPVATTVIPGSMTINHAAGSADYVFSGPGILSATGTLTKEGTGGAIIAVSNSSTGAVIINAGSLQIGNGGAVGGLGNGSVTNNAALIFNHTHALTQNNVISGTGSLTKSGSGTLTLGGTSNFSGNTVVTAGTLRVSNFLALGDATGAVTVQSGGALDIGGITPADVGGGFQSKQFNIAGTGVGGTGALVNTGNSQNEAFQRITLTADATIGGTGRMDLRNGGATLNLAGFNLTKAGTNTFNVAGGFISDGNIIVNAGVFSIECNTAVTDFASGKNITVNNATLQLIGAEGTLTITRPVVLNGTVTNGTSATVGASALGSTIQLTGNGTAAVNANGANNQLTLVGAISQDASPRSLTKTGELVIVLFW